MDDQVPSKRELHSMITNQGWLLVATSLGLVVVTCLLIQKGVLSASDFTNLLAE